MNYVPTNISRPNPGLLQANWDDGYTAIIKLETLRKACPCADCLEKSRHKPLKNKFIMPTMRRGQFDLKALTPTGNYAVSTRWGDGHSAGIYTWDYFRSVFEQFKMSDEEIKIYLANLEKETNNRPESQVRSNG
ncbi:MAG TPA: DUF971 domain-containing protein [Candidatus Kapabacteria bacterium]|nr:DUF971 domain-containing protein [Candidatus Kapabacteria bacterium]